MKTRPLSNTPRILLLLMGLVTPYWMSPANADTIHWNGFATTGGTKSDSNAGYLNDSIVRPLTWNADSNLGLNAHTDFSDSWSVSAQLLALSYSNNLQVRADWFFATYQLNNSYAILVGKQKFPVWLISDRYDVGFIRPWIRPPQEIYSFSPVNTFFGATFSSTFFTGIWELKGQLYGGAADERLNYGFSQLEVTLANIRGVALTAISDAVTLRVGYTDAQVTGQNRFNVDTPQPGGLLVRNSLGVPFSTRVRFFSLGAKVDCKNFLSYVEYAREGSDGPFVSGREAGYGTLGYQLGRILPHYTFAVQDLRQSNPGTAYQYSHTLGARAAVGSNVDVKAEWQLIRVLAGNGLFTSNPGSGYVNVWSAALDFIF